MREFLAAQQRRWSQAESQLLDEVEHLLGELSGSGPASGAAAETAAARDDGQQQHSAEVELLKGRIAELEWQLAQAQSCSRGPVGGVLDWEAEKRRILTALESETDADCAADNGQRTKLEQVIRTTDEIVADKQREVTELQGLLASQSSNLATVAVGAAALGKSLDQDAIIRHEREALKQLQEQWRDKLRQAEIEISLERAQIARQKAEVERPLSRLGPAVPRGGRPRGGRQGRRAAGPRPLARPPRPEEPGRTLAVAQRLLPSPLVRAALGVRGKRRRCLNQMAALGPDCHHPNHLPEGEGTLKRQFARAAVRAIAARRRRPV